MKKFKYILITVFACLFCFLFASCGKAAYVENSFTCTVDYHRYNTIEDTIQIDGSLKIDLPSAGNYNVSFYLKVFNSSNKKVADVLYTTTVSGLGEQTVNIYKYLESDVKADKDDTYTAEISQIKIEKQKTNDDFKGYAIGFGVTGGVLLIAATVFFAVTKVKEKH